jgi:hypothetical protein
LSSSKILRKFNSVKSYLKILFFSTATFWTIPVLGQVLPRAVYFFVVLMFTN